MKYKVSLLPEKNRKRINSKKKAEKVKIISLIALCMMLVLLLVSISLKFLADAVLLKENTKNAEYADVVMEKEMYMAKNQTLKDKLALIESIQVDEPALYNFVASLSNIDRPDISIETMDCTDWKSARSCTLTGTVHSAEAYDAYVNQLYEIEGVTNVTTSQFSTTRVDGVTTYQFILVITCSGGKAPAVIADTTAAQ